jgi:membrane associated rhomboid family serine protease
MTPAPVGIRCPEHSGKPQGIQRVTTGVRRAGYEGTGAIVTKSLVAINVAAYLLMLASGSSLTQIQGEAFIDYSLIGHAFFNGEEIGVGAGEWYRMITSMFLHGSIIHLGMNMLMLWIIGSAMEAALGRGRYLALYFVSGLAGAAGALLLTEQNVPTVGASGAIFGLLGAALVLEQQRHYVLGGSALPTIVLNLVFTFAVPNISIGGHLGGLIGGAACGLVLSRFGRGHAAYGRLGILGVVGLAAVAAASILVAYVRVRGYT